METEKLMIVMGFTLKSDSAVLMRLIEEDSMEGNTPAAPVSDVGSGRLPSPLPFEDAQMRSPATLKLTGDVIGSGRDAAADERITEPVSAQSSSIKRALDATSLGDTSLGDTSLGDTSLGDIVDYGEPVVKRSRSCDLHNLYEKLS